MFQRLNHYSQSLMFFVLIVCLFGKLLPASSRVLKNYTPPPDSGPPSGISDNLSSRGRCNSNNEISFIALSPLTHTGQVASLTPTFAWFSLVSERLETDFQLFSYTTSRDWQPLGKPIQGSNSQGLMTFTPDNAEFNLIVGETYRWQVTIKCDPGNRSEEVIIGASFRVVEMPSELQSRLSDVSDPAQKSKIYAQAGYWYNAFSTALELSQDNQLGDAVSELLLDLADVEERENSQLLSEEDHVQSDTRINSLRLIAELRNEE